MTKEVENRSLTLYRLSLVEENYDKYYTENSVMIHKTFRLREWNNIDSMEKVRLITFNKALNYGALHNRVGDVMELIGTDEEGSKKYIEDKHNDIVREATLFEFEFPEELRELQYFINMHYRKVVSGDNTYYNLDRAVTVDDVARELNGWVPDIKKEHLLYTKGFVRFINRDYRAIGRSALHSYMSVVRSYNRFNRVVAAAYLQYVVGKKRALTLCGLDRNTRLGLKSLIVTIYKRNQTQTVEPAVALGVMYSEEARNYIDKYNSRLTGGFQDEIRRYFYTKGLRYFSRYYRDSEMEKVITKELKETDSSIEGVSIDVRIRKIKHELIDSLISSV